MTLLLRTKRATSLIAGVLLSLLLPFPGGQTAQARSWFWPLEWGEGAEEIADEIAEQPADEPLEELVFPPIDDVEEADGGVQYTDVSGDSWADYYLDDEETLPLDEGPDVVPWGDDAADEEVLEFLEFGEESAPEPAPDVPAAEEAPAPAPAESDDGSPTLIAPAPAAPLWWNVQTPGVGSVAEQPAPPPADAPVRPPAPVPDPAAAQESPDAPAGGGAVNCMPIPPGPADEESESDEGEEREVA